ncbi:MAG: hypothetical protein IJD05_05980, partial [Bacteroidaceae bacterium]|nr:hypothetical protein [Bacteroidaceae bacterium]
EFECFACVFSQTPSPRSGTPSYPRGRVVFSLFVNMLSKLLLLKRRWIQKLVFEDGGVLFLIAWFCCHSGGFRTPSELFSRKKFSSLFKRT